MTELNFKIGNSPNLPQNRENGTFYIAEDEKKMYLNDIVFGDTTNLETKERVSEIDETVSKAINELNNSCGFTQKIKYQPKNEITSGTTSLSEAIDVLADTKQETLVSGTNIKTINGESILGTGNLTIENNIQDAPSDGKTYGRNNGSWSSITIPEGETIINIGEISKHVPEETPLSIVFDSIDLFDQYTKNGVYKFTLNPYHVIGMLLVNIEQTSPGYITQILKFGESSVDFGTTLMSQCNDIYAYRIGKLTLEGYSWSEWKKSITSLE